MEAHTQQDMSEEQLRKIERVASGREAELITEIRRHRQREAELVVDNQKWITLYEGTLAPELNSKSQKISDLETALNLQEGLYQEADQVRREAYIEGWQDCEEHQKDRIDDIGGYARGVRVP